MVQLFELLSGAERLSLLWFFLDRPSASFSQTEVIKNTGIAKTTVVKWLAFFEKEALLHVQKIGVTKLYSLARDNIIVKHLKVLKSLSVLDDLHNLSLDVEIYIYGSASRGEDDENSDIDILVIGDKKRDEIFNIFENISKNIGKTINYQVFTHKSWSLMRKKDPAFYERVEKDKIRLR